MIERSELSPAEKDALHSLCEEYIVATRRVTKDLRALDPAKPGTVLLFLEDEAKAAEVLATIKRLIGTTD